MAYQCKACGAVFEEPKPKINLSKDVKDRVPDKEEPDKCCPICGADQGQFCKVYEEAKAERYD